MNPRASLSRFLAKYGEDVVLRRTVGTQNQVNIDATVRGFVRRADPNPLAGANVQADTTVIISGAAIDAAQWPGGQLVTSPPSTIDPRVPRPGGSDKVVVQGRVRTVIESNPTYDSAGLIRVDLVVRG
jgi:hypothetical protein